MGNDFPQKPLAKDVLYGFGGEIQDIFFTLILYLFLFFFHPGV
jgi:hypothetical protein